MTKLILTFLFFFPMRSLACAPWGCYSMNCLSYGPVSLKFDDSDTCRQSQLSHLDPNNWTDTNFDILAVELTGGYRSNTISEPIQEPAEPQTLPPVEGRDAFWHGVAAFRENNFDQAVTFFRQASEKFAEKDRKGPDVDVAAYYLGRALMRAAQKDFDGYQRSTVNKALAREARSVFLKFIEQAKNHEWVDSARGLARRGSYLAEDWADFLHDWGQAVDYDLTRRPRSLQRIQQLFDEASRLDLGTLTTTSHLHPILWLIRSYYVTRELPPTVTPDDGEPTSPPASFDLDKELKALENDKPSFSNHPDLFAWSKAVLLLKKGQAKEGFELLQKQTVAKANSGSLSWVILNARMEMAMGNYPAARTRLESFIKNHPVELSMKRKTSFPPSYYTGPSFAKEDPDLNPAVDARNFYAMTFFWQGRTGDIITKKNNELLTSPPLLRVAIQGSSPESLVGLLKKKDIPRDLRIQLERLVLTKLIALNEWRLANEAFGLSESSEVKKSFSNLELSVRTLIDQPNDASANAYVGIFVAAIEPNPRIFAHCKQGTFSDIKEAMEFYLTALAGFQLEEKQKKKPNPLEATLLRQMLICFKDHRDAPYCGSRAEKWGDNPNKIPLAERKKWYLRLKKRFPDSKEAKAQTFYW